MQKQLHSPPSCMKQKDITHVMQSIMHATPTASRNSLQVCRADLIACSTTRPSVATGLPVHTKPARELCYMHFASVPRVIDCIATAATVACPICGRRVPARCERCLDDRHA